MARTPGGEFLECQDYEGRITQDRLAVARIKAAAIGPAVDEAAEAALQGPPGWTEDFVLSGHHFCGRGQAKRTPGGYVCRAGVSLRD